MGERLSQQEVNLLLEDVDNIPDKLNSFQSDAFNYLIDYVEMGDDGIYSSHEGERLFKLCVDILTQYLWDHGWRPKK